MVPDMHSVIHIIYREVGAHVLYWEHGTTLHYRFTELIRCTIHKNATIEPDVHLNNPRVI
jgi:hypothetical protein